MGISKYLRFWKVEVWDVSFIIGFHHVLNYNRVTLIVHIPGAICKSLQLKHTLHTKWWSLNGCPLGWQHWLKFCWKPYGKTASPYFRERVLACSQQLMLALWLMTAMSGKKRLFHNNMKIVDLTRFIYINQARLDLVIICATHFIKVSIINIPWVSI